MILHQHGREGSQGKMPFLNIWRKYVNEIFEFFTE